jgi:hypothetical protein
MSTTTPPQQQKKRIDYKKVWQTQKLRMRLDPEYAQQEKDRKVEYLHRRYHTDPEFREKMRIRMREYMRHKRASERSN